MSTRARILLVEDNTRFRLLTARLLRNEGYACDVAPDAARAWVLLSETTYDLLIVEQDIPGNVNSDFLVEVMRHLPGLPIIAVARRAKRHPSLRECQLPVAAALLKPFLFATLVAEIQTALQRQ